MRLIIAISLLCVCLTACGRRNIPMPPDETLQKTAPLVRDIKLYELNTRHTSMQAERYV